MCWLHPAFSAGAVAAGAALVKQNRPGFRAGKGSGREGKE